MDICNCPRATTTYVQCPHTGPDAHHRFGCPGLTGEECICKSCRRTRKRANPWDSMNGDWACDCRSCVLDRAAWPETTRMWMPRPGESVRFARPFRSQSDER